MAGACIFDASFNKGACRFAIGGILSVRMPVLKMRVFQGASPALFDKSSVYLIIYAVIMQQIKSKPVSSICLWAVIRLIDQN